MLYHQALQGGDVHRRIVAIRNVIAIAKSALEGLTDRCVYRNIKGMKRLSRKIINDFGGIKALADLVEAPVSTANSWRHRITDSRLNHLRLAALAAGRTVSWDTLEDASPIDEPDTAAAA